MTIGTDTGNGKDIQVEDRYIKPTPEFPDGSYLHTVDGKVKVATGYYAKIYPGKPSPYWHGRAPIFVVDIHDCPWMNQTDNLKGR